MPMSLFGKKSESSASNVENNSFASNANRNTAAKMLENSEELFRASLTAKNEEISKITDVLFTVRKELGREVAHVQTLNAQLAAAQNELQEKEVSLQNANNRIRELESQIEDMQGTYNKVIMGEGQRPADEAKEDDTSTTQEELHAELVQSLRERAVKSEREVAVLQSTVAALRNALLVQLEEVARKSQDDTKQEQPSMTEAKIWEEAAMESERKVKELALEIEGKDLVIAELRRRLDESSKKSS